MDGNTYNVNVTRKHKKAFQGRHETAMKLILLMKFYSRKTYIKLFYYKNWHKRSHFKQKLKELTALQSQCLVIWIFAFSFSCAKNKSLTDSLLISAQGQCLALGPPCLAAFIWRPHPQWVHSSVVTLCDFCLNALSRHSAMRNVFSWRAEPSSVNCSQNMCLQRFAPDSLQLWDGDDKIHGYDSHLACPGRLPMGSTASAPSL